VVRRGRERGISGLPAELDPRTPES